MTGLAPVAGTVVALTFLVGPSAAAEPAQPDRRPVSDQRALLLLTRATKAARTTPYAGVQFVSRWSAGGTTSLLVEVRHVPGEGTLMQVRGTSAGPGSAVFTPSESEAVTGGPATGGGPVGLLARNYSVVPVGSDRVAGRSARVLESRRRDGSVAGRFWLDDETALLLRREVFDRQGAMIRASAFIGITLGVPQLSGHLPPMLPDAWRARVSDGDLAALRASGWRCPDGLPSDLDLYDVRRSEDEAENTLHASYSDGLSTVSLFEQKGRLDVQSLAGYQAERWGKTTVYVRDGVQQSIVWSADGSVFTVLADAPQETIQAVVAALPQEQVDTGVVARLERGMRRVASWMNPFG